MDTDVIKFIEQADIFASIDSRSKLDLSSGARVIDLQSDQLIFSSGDQATKLYFILSGEISVEIYSPEGQLLVLTILKSGQVLGEFGVIDGKPRSASARTLTETKIAEIPAALFKKTCRRNPHIDRALLEKLIAIVRQNNMTIEDLVLNPLNLRVVNALYTEAFKLAHDGASSAEPICIKITQTNLADRVSGSREKVNACLRILEEKNLIRRGRMKIFVLDFERLGALSSSL